MNVYLATFVEKNYDKRPRLFKIGVSCIIKISLFTKVCKVGVLSLDSILYSYKVMLNKFGDVEHWRCRKTFLAVNA